MGAADLRNKAKDAFRRKQYDLAVEMYTESLRFEPDDRQAVEGFFQAAKKAREAKGKGFSFLSKFAVGSSKDPAKRMHSCFGGLAKSPEDKGLLMSLGEAAADASAFETAAVAYQQAAEADEKDNTAWKRLGEMLGKKGRIAEALEALSRAINLDPRDQEAIKLRKNMAAEGALKGGFESAKSSRDLMKDQSSAQKLEQDVKIQLTDEHAGAEIEKTKELIAKEPTNARHQVRLGDLHLQRNEEPEAVKAFQEGLRLDPRNFDLSVRIGNIRLGELERKYVAARDAAKASPQDAALAQARDAAGKALLDGRLEEFGRRVKEHPLDLSERFRLGKALLESGRVDDAASEFQQTVRDPGRKVDSLLLLASCFEKKKLLGLAVKKVEEALADFPSLATPLAKHVHYTYADLLERKGDRDKARGIFEQIYEVDITYRDVPKRLEALTTEA